MPDNTNIANVDNVSAGEPLVAGAIYRAVIDNSLTIPTSALTELPEAFVTLGYISEDGYVNNNSRSSTPVKDWSGSEIASLQDSKTDTFKYKMLEIIKEVVNKEIFGDENVTGSIDTEMIAKANAKELTEHAYVIDVLLKGGYIRRTVIPKGKITEISEIAYKKTDLVGYEVTVTAYPSDSEGNTHFEYTAKPTGATGATGSTGA
ncbi:MAG: phage tail protein [Mogibacterium sp.]|nr:phage tail protein [Mogibacterium sp.]